MGVGNRCGRCIMCDLCLDSNSILIIRERVQVLIASILVHNLYINRFNTLERLNDECIYEIK